jgi:hypothetical protein
MGSQGEGKKNVDNLFIDPVRLVLMMSGRVPPTPITRIDYQCTSTNTWTETTGGGGATGPDVTKLDETEEFCVRGASPGDIGKLGFKDPRITE